MPTLTRFPLPDGRRLAILPDLAPGGISMEPPALREVFSRPFAGSMAHAGAAT